MSPGLLETRVILVPLLVAGFFLGYKLCFKIHHFVSFSQLTFLLFVRENGLIVVLHKSFKTQKH